jgi:hypothetical protein
VRRLTCALVVLACAVGTSRVAGAQDQKGRFEVSGGIRWIGPVDFGAVPANETAPGGGTRALFTSTTTLDASVGGTATVGVRLSKAFRAELAVAYNPTSMTSHITGDAEVVGNVAVDAPVSQFLIEGGIVAQLRRWQRGRVSPFLTAGAGYLRQLNDGRTLVDTGQGYYLGGGFYYVRESAKPRALKARGARVDVRALALHGGVAPDDAYHWVPAVTASVFARF